MKEHYLHLLQYDQWANLHLLKHVEGLPEDIFHKPMDSVFPSVSATFYHIFRGDRIWFKRCEPNLEIIEDIIEFRDIATAEKSFIELYKIVFEFLSLYYDEEREIVYQNTKGTVLKYKMNDIIYHLVNHGTYHRGNIAAMIRQLGFKGTSTDYIQYLRN